jgi:hypothetical protein
LEWIHAYQDLYDFEGYDFYWLAERLQERGPNIELTLQLVS